MQNQIVCFGEMLWDILPTGKQAGGAPMNVAVHLHQLGMHPLVISKVGKDAMGEGLLEFLKTKGLQTESIQADATYPTGIVNANVSSKQEVTYDIVRPAAWDFIEWDAHLEKQVSEAEAFVYGSLVARSDVSSDTLQKLLGKAKLKIMDVNLRPPHYQKQSLEALLSQADLVKLNHHELSELSGWWGDAKGLKEQMQLLVKKFGLQALCVTRGEKGAILWMQDEFTAHPGYVVQVEDTIGSGDSFLAAFLKNYLMGKAAAEILPYACAVGALVASRRGATPLLLEAEISQMMGK